MLVSDLVRQFGLNQLAAAEDAVQWSMTQALEHWPRNGEPDNPTAWLFTVARRHILSDLRAKKIANQHSLQVNKSASETSKDKLDEAFPGELNDALLCMLFVACDKSIPVESQLVFTLKCLCGFSVKEISLRLFVSEANVYKRYARAKKAMANMPNDLMALSDEDIASRLDAVLTVLYLLFTEGYLSSSEDSAIRKDLCEEALRLTQLIAHSRYANLSKSNACENDAAKVYALLALMYFNFARLDTRSDAQGLVLLAQQPRHLWDHSMIALALTFLERAARGDCLSRYHLEASIAAEHCLAKSFVETRWDKIVKSYELLSKIADSPLLLLNRALAMAEWKTPIDALSILSGAKIPDWLHKSYHWYAVLADLQFRSGQDASAKENAQMAMQLAPTEAIKNALQSRFNGVN